MAVLTGEENEQAQRIIKNATPGEYELSKLYGAEWSNVHDRPAFGKRFKGSVNLHLSGIENVGRRSNNHQIYKILPRQKREQ